jgi:hypothetical protein
MNQLTVLKWIAEAIDKADALSKASGEGQARESKAQPTPPPAQAQKAAVLNHLDHAIQLVDGIVKNCGAGSAGSPGFEPGNSCAGGGGGGSSGGGRADTFEEVSARHDAKVDKEDREEAAANARHEADTSDEVGPPKERYKAGEAPASGMQPPKPHTVKLPKSKRRLNIDTAAEAIKQMGYTHKSKTAPDEAGKWSTTFTLTDSKGKSVVMSSKGHVNFIYANQAK